MANLLPTVLVALLFRNATILNTRRSVNDVTRVIQWVYSARARMSTCFVTTVRTPPDIPSTYAHHIHRIRTVRR